MKIFHSALVASYFILNAFSLISQNQFLYFNDLTFEDNLTSQSYNYYIYKDKKNFVWISSIQGLNIYTGQEIKQYKYNEDDKGVLSDNNILSNFFEDKKQNVWFSTQDAIQSYQKTKDEFTNLSINIDRGIKAKGAYYLLYRDTSNNDMWIRYKDSLFVVPNYSIESPIFIGKYHMNIRSVIDKNEKNNYFLLTPLAKGIEFRQFRNYYELTQPDTLLRNSLVRTVLIDKENLVWVGTKEGLIKLNIDLKTSQEFYNKKTINIQSIAIVDSSQILVATQSQGLHFFNPQKNEYSGQIFYSNEQGSKSFPYQIDRIYVDKDKTLWVSTSGRGIFFTQLNRKKINHFFRQNSLSNYKDNSIRSITEDTRGNILCLTREGINILTNKTSKQSYVPLILDNANSITYDKEDGIWVCDFSGLYYKQKEDVRFKKFNDASTNSPLGFFFVKQLKNGKKITTTSKGVFQIDVPNNDLIEIKGLKDENTPFIWIEENLETSQILLRKDQEKFIIGHFNQDTFKIDTTILFKDLINFLHFDRIDKKYWIATSNGLFWLEYKGSEYQLKKDTILEYQTLLGVLRENDSNNLWLSCNEGIIKYNIITHEQKKYGLIDGVQSLEFNFRSAYKTKSGQLLFGGVNGLNIFDPKEIKDNAKKATPTITSILINDEPPTKKLTCTKTAYQNISYIQALEFPQEENTLSFYFAALDYVNPNANEFRYRMIGEDKKSGKGDRWVYSETKNFARYSNLEPRTYTFEVDATNADGIWSNTPAQLLITIHPPWYRTWWAYTTYGLLSILLLYIIYRFQLNQRLRAAEAYRLKELDQIKTALYTNITHEFRTPLTVILGMADQIKRKPKKGLQEGVTMIMRSGQHLLGLVNQMLDLAKIESGNMQAEYVQGDIGAYCQYIVESYQSYAASKQINLVFYNEVGVLMMDYDVDKLQAILTNLLSNATKFTPESGKIIVHLNKKIEHKHESFCQLKIKDTGIGIAQKDVPHIFDRFYQADDKTTRNTGGTGIGLALTKELVELIDGTISVNSRLHKGTEFIITLPIHRNAPLAKEINDQQVLRNTEHLSEEISTRVAQAKHSQSLIVQEEKDDLPLVLLIEDNLDILTYLQSCLEDEYRVLMALNGQVGIDRALEEIPDIIITDVMMPEKDGYEVCDLLKQEERTSHIPIIMLTAKAHIDDKITGISKGADAYLSKPFHQAELEVRLAQLLAQRKRLQAYYSQQSLAAAPAKVENLFLQTIIDLVESDLMADLDIPTLSKKLAMEKTTIYRKVKALTGESTTLYIRRIRLKNAYHLLTTTDLSISEIAYAVGFKDPAFFSRCFSKIYGQSPSSIRNK